MPNLYNQELEQIPNTIAWALDFQIDKLASHIKDSLDLPLFAVGSGGSFSAANMAVLLHQRSGKIANAFTPLNFANLINVIPNNNVLLLSASGKNPDINSALNTIPKLSL